MHVSCSVKYKQCIHVNVYRSILWVFNLSGMIMGDIFQRNMFIFTQFWVFFFNTGLKLILNTSSL